MLTNLLLGIGNFWFYNKKCYLFACLFIYCSSVNKCLVMLLLSYRHSLLIFQAGEMLNLPLYFTVFDLPLLSPEIMQNKCWLTETTEIPFWVICQSGTIWEWLSRLWQIETFSCDCVWCHASKDRVVFVSLFTSGACKEENHFTFWWWFSLCDLSWHLQRTDHAMILSSTFLHTHVHFTLHAHGHILHTM